MCIRDRDYTEEELKDCIAKAYDSKFDTEEIAPMAKAGGMYFLELFHGKTIAFKDMALSILPHLMTTAAKKNHCLLYTSKPWERERDGFQKNWWSLPQSGMTIWRNAI